MERVGKTQAGKNQDLLYPTVRCCPLGQHLEKKGEQSAHPRLHVRFLLRPAAGTAARPAQRGRATATRDLNASSGVPGPGQRAPLLATQCPRED